MEKTADKIDRLLIVITRVYATRGGDDDEFVNEWGMEAGKESDWPEPKKEHKGRRIVVIHGCDEFNNNKKYPILLENVLKNGDPYKRTLVDDMEILIYEHGMEEKEREKLQKDVQSLFSGKKVSWAKYSGGGEQPAIFGLIDQLDDDILKKIVMEAAQGPEVFIRYLHMLQNHLLCLHLNLTTLIHDPNNKGAINSAEESKKKFDIVLKFDSFWERLNTLAKYDPDKQISLRYTNEDIDRILWWNPNIEHPFQKKPADSVAAFLEDPNSIAYSRISDKDQLQNDIQTEMRLQARSLERIILASRNVFSALKSA